MDGSIDWWCVPNLDSPPLFDRMLDPECGGYFAVAPNAPFRIDRQYRADSNVLETIFTTATGRARLTESMNSGTAGRLPWTELARRIDGLDGHVTFDIHVRFGRRAETINPYVSAVGDQSVFHAGHVLGLFRTSDGITVRRLDDAGLEAGLSVGPGDRETIAIVAGEDEPLVVPTIEDIDGRIDGSDAEWKQWAGKLRYDGVHRDALVRSALALKLLLFSPSGAIAAAATTSLPERIGGTKNYDYRYAWVRDAGYTIKAFLAVDAQAEAKAAFTWLLRRLKEHGAQVCYTLDGGLVPEAREIALPGYRGSTPVLVGNAATDQHQHGVYGDIFGTAAHFVSAGHILDASSAETLAHLADECADRWRQPDSGIWELPDARHYTMSKISCWQALARAAELASAGQLPTTCRDRWIRERDRIAAWIDEHCWSDEIGSYLFYPGADGVDAAIALAVPFGFPNPSRLRQSLDAIDRTLGAGPYHYRYHGASREEGCFLACSLWMVEARALLGQQDEAERAYERLIAAMDRGVGIYAEMADPGDGHYLGNVPQGLTHLALVMAITSLAHR
ncbi:glycoside hydrolase family 15 protein [Sphingomonas abietis]|uniref:Glycoside hydrolase family 15 protein n=1 Tax=Sphingomonas abietis TaxID=3012344 RepID=A0ABY7NT26_9SPHN|nr:glycoside hydrolase family 15 protein [Sphingomonas abietis]WBO24655.1 glycoside hydrolase family 15 protein [Sphingomonas abietis]